jgi:2-methoxy-6-polyprenyl-1,4-benzoquinol methylase
MQSSPNFVQPTNESPSDRLYRLYSFTFIPSLGHILAGDRDSYQYLIESIERFPTQAQFARMIQTAGFALPGSDTAHQLGWSHFPTTSSGSVVDSLAGVGLGIASRLPGIGSVIAQQQEMMERQRRENLDVLGTWEDLTFGIASIWTGIKPMDAGARQ